MTIKDVECPNCQQKGNFAWFGRTLKCENCGFEITLSHAERDVFEFLELKYPQILSEYLEFSKREET